jgi:hypothetical protein
LDQRHLRMKILLFGASIRMVLFQDGGQID